MSMFKCHQVREQSKEIFCEWKAYPSMLTSIRVLINQEGQFDPVEEKTVRRPEAIFTGPGLSYGVMYTIAVGSLRTSVYLKGPS